MGELMSKFSFIKTYHSILFYLLVISIFFTPDFTISTSLPTFQLADFILPFIALAVLFSFKNIKWNHYYTLLLVFCAIIILAMAINGRMGVLSDYFEIFKVIKFGILILFATQAIKYVKLNQLIKATFILLLIINLIQYLELFQINDLLINWYGYEKEVMGFGRDTLGFPATKRMFGLMGNPNNNAIIFLFFAIYFFSSEYGIKKSLFFYLAVFMLFLCQSKIAIIAFIVIFILGINYFSHTKKAILSKSGIVLTIIVIVFIIDGRYVTDVVKQLFGFLMSGEEKSELFNNVGGMSTRGRLESWKLLFEMIIKKPIIGHAPYKEFFYERTLYSENEYILMWWRYGIVGLVAYIGLLVKPIKMALSNKSNQIAHVIFLFSVVLLITALTNNPLSNRNILTLYAILLGIFFTYKNQLTNERQ